MELSKFFRKKHLFLLAIVGIFTALSLGFICANSYINYRAHLKSYKASQALEIGEIKHKVQNIKKDVESLLDLTSTRIKASQNDVNRIHTILSSFDYFSLNLNLPIIQKFSYSKLKGLPQLITRFGVTPLNTEFYPTENHIKKGTFVYFNGDAIIGKSCILDEENSLIGILQVEIAISDFQSFMGNFTTIIFNNSHLANYTLIQKEPFPIYAINPESFWSFVKEYKSYYSVFFFYMGITLTILFFLFHYISLQLKRTYITKISELKKSISLKKDEVEKLRKDKENLSQEQKNQLLSLQSNKKIHVSIKKRQQEHALHIQNTLEVVKKSLQNTRIYLSESDRLDLLESCFTTAHTLSKNSVKRTKKDKIELMKVIEEIQMFFAEKLYKSNIFLEIISSQIMPLEGDKLLIELILINAIGKSIYRAPRNGKVSIVVTSNDSNTHLEVIDNGYSLADTAGKVSTKSFEHCLNDDVFYGICQEIRLSYELVKAENGQNIARITIPQDFIEKIDNNVVNLF